MGYGAYMTVTNQSSQAYLIAIPEQNCMYDNGDEGSWLSYFNNLTVQPGTSFPDTPNGVYIEAKASGSCLFEPSTFTMVVDDLGYIYFKETDNAYYSEQPSYLTVSINNSSSAAQITVTITAQEQ